MPAMKTIQQMRDELLLKGMSGGGEVKAPVTPTGFYSPLEEAALRIQRKVGNAQAFMNDLKTVPKDHIQHAGVDNLLTSRPTITREELQQYVAQAAPKVEVKVLGGAGSTFKNMNRAEMAQAYERIVGYDPVEEDPHITDAELRRQLEGFAREAGEADGITEDGRPMPKHSEWQLPGGENYREVLLTLPTNDARKVARRAELAELDRNRPLSDEEQKEFDSLRDFAKGGNAYRSNHWDEPNVLAHFRINDRTDNDGKKVLFVEEIQSDWGQEGKKKGFSKEVDRAAIEARMQEITARLRQIAKAVTPEQVPAMEAEWNRLSDEKSSLADSLVKAGQGVPSAPFVTKTNDWVNLALKHILKMAAEEGHDRVAFVKGEQAADRFGLDKHFSRVAARPTPTGGYQLQTILKDGSREDSVDVPPNKLHEYVGEDLAKKIHGQGGGVFEGGDLKMPQMGMRRFYDELVPAQAHALVKKFGGQGVKPIQVQTGEQGAQVVPNGTGWGVVWSDGVFTPAKSREHADQLVAPYTEHPGFDITPEMRQAILKPMSYKVGGAVPAMDAMRLQVWDKRRGR